MSIKGYYYYFWINLTYYKTNFIKIVNIVFYILYFVIVFYTSLYYTQYIFRFLQKTF